MCKEYFAVFGSNSVIQENAIVGFKYREGCEKTIIGSHAIIRTGTIIYADCIIGNYFTSGHNVVIREKTVICDHVTIGTNTVIDGYVRIGSFVKIESQCYIPTHVIIGKRVFIGPNVVMTNDRYPLKMRNTYKPCGPKIEDGVTIGANSTLLPGITIGYGSFIAAGSVVTKDVPPLHLAKGNPARFFSIPDKLKEKNIALSWQKYIAE